MNFWIGGGLGFALNQVELAIDRLFGISKNDGEYSELDSSILLRSALKDRIDGLARAVQGGIFSPNEARARESLPAAKEGNEPRVQQQVVPLSAWDKALTAPPASNGTEKINMGEKPDEDEDKPDPEEAKAYARFLLQRTMDSHAA
jgi:hypothetical protein